MLSIIESIKSFILKYRYFLICIFFLFIIIIYLVFCKFGVQQQVVQHKENNIESFAHHNQKNTSKSDNKEQQIDSKQPTTVFVDIKGAVKRPNVYEMKSTDRIKQLLDKAGVQDNADLSQINLSERLIDQRMIIIPKKGDTKSQNLSKSINENNIKNTQGTEKVNLNIVTESELQNIPGIGSTKAKAIIAYRNESGGFKNVEDLKKVNGIGEKTFEKLREYFIV
ncbi:helix-hairpin-helix domain-containing protein [Staphylococcus sp. ACRSN]|uniref:helix-hairpin-helix domain-containing protein n=1 Tax=Staphylococcus sp. ACRSN TaxID=2918214 RepID=UPI001EF1A6DA|nr:helix-hairpin-helix domain-containing protein [Staphylococcus sp. ACRSN]MCG7338575.1 helix-hairpin-helix domain-containing protein [Staphylococcus sp. ACRSN]